MCVGPAPVTEAVWWLYLLRTAAGTLYTGISTDPDRRLAEHEAGRGARSLRGRGPLELVFRLRTVDRSEALRLEAAVKALDRRRKERVVAGNLDPRTLLADPQPD